MADLVKRSNALIVGSEPSLTPQEITLGKELELSRQNAKAEIEPMLAKEFYREFASQSLDALEWAFREHRRRSPYMPAISEITGLLSEYRIKERRRLEEESAALDRQRMQEARAKGELIEFSDIKKMCVKLAEKAGPLPKMEEMIKPIPALPPMDELIRRRNKQIKAVQEKHGSNH